MLVKEAQWDIPNMNKQMNSMSEGRLVHLDYIMLKVSL